MKTVYKSLIMTILMIASQTIPADEHNHIAKVDANGKVVTDYKLITEAGEAKAADHYTPVKTALESTTYNGQPAIDFLGTRINEVAAAQNVDVEYLKNQFITDSTMRVDKDGNVLYVDEIPSSTSQQDLPNTVVFTGDASKLHSKPGAKKVIYLDTDGYDASHSVWANYGVPSFLPWTASPDKVYQVWSMVAEDYAPFDVDVTTEYPGEDALNKTDAADEYYGTHAVLTDTPTDHICTRCGGIAYLGTFNRIYNPATMQYTFQPVLIFGSLGSAKNMAEATSHEVGHSLSLHHDGYNDGVTKYDYYTGTGEWAPIMGVGYYSYTTQWSKGEYYGANNKEDDLAIISSYIPYRVDNVSDTPELATGLEAGSYHLTRAVMNPVYDVIETNTDVDVYTFTTVGGTVDFTIKPKTINQSPENMWPMQFSNLRAKMELTDEGGNVVATGTYQYNYNEKHNSTLTATLSAGKYYLKISGEAYANPYPSVNNEIYFTKYASLGQYELTGEYPSEFIPAAPTAIINSSATSGVGPLSVNFDGTSSTVGYGTGIKYYWDFGDGEYSSDATPVHVFKTSGETTVTLTVYNDADLTSTITTTVNVTAPATNIVKVKKLAMKLSYVKKYNITNVTITGSFINELKKATPYVTVCGTLEGFTMQPGMLMCTGTTKSGALTLKTGVQGKNGTMKYTINYIMSTTNPTMVYDKGSSVKTMVLMTK